MGMGLAAQLSRANEVRIGSRDAGKASIAAARIAGVKGGTNANVARWCDAAIVAVPFSGIGALKELDGALAGKLVVSIVNPLRTEGPVLQYASDGPSAAELVARALPRSAVSTAFNNIAAAFIRRPPEEGLSVLIAAGTRETYERTAGLVRSIPRMEPLYAGPLSQAQSVERLTVVVLNAAALNGVSRFSPKFVSK